MQWNVIYAIFILNRNMCLYMLGKYIVFRWYVGFVELIVVATSKETADVRLAVGYLYYTLRFGWLYD